jgi:hypothetical protein
LPLDIVINTTLSETSSEAGVWTSPGESTQSRARRTPPAPGSSRELAPAEEPTSSREPPSPRETTPSRELTLPREPSSPQQPAPRESTSLVAPRAINPTIGRRIVGLLNEDQAVIQRCRDYNRARGIDFTRGLCGSSISNSLGPEDGSRRQLRARLREGSFPVEPREIHTNWALGPIVPRSAALYQRIEMNRMERLRNNCKFAEKPDFDERPRRLSFASYAHIEEKKRLG